MEEGKIINYSIHFRNEEVAQRIISELKEIQPDGELTFIKKDLSLLKNVDEVCDEIKSKEDKMNLLFMTQGTLSLKGRNGKCQVEFLAHGLELM